MPATRTALQIEASRRNGARSRGPKTAAGKARSARNATRHGIASRTFVLVREEERAAHAALCTDLSARLRPRGALEEHWVQRLLDALWRLSRLDLLEARALEALLEGGEGGGLPSLATLCRYRARIARDIRDAEERLRELRAARLEETARRTARDPARLRALAAILEGRRNQEPDPPPREEGRNEPRPAPPPPPAAAAGARPRDDGNEPGQDASRRSGTPRRGTAARTAGGKRGPGTSDAGSEAAAGDTNEPGEGTPCRHPGTVLPHTHPTRPEPMAGAARAAGKSAGTIVRGTNEPGKPQSGRATLPHLPAAC